ncbi:MAG: DNA-3-methyladenine glycosylase 2 [Gammaproteobacteria bacterium]
MELAIPLPPGYRIDDALGFHARDLEAVAEQVGPGWLRKGVLLDGVPVALGVVFEDGQARYIIDADGPITPTVEALAREALTSMLALRIDPAPFLLAVAGDPVLGPVALHQPQLRIVQSASIFEALTWAIMGQQINLSFAIALRRTFIQQAGRRHSTGLWCYPEPRDVARLDLAELTTRKFSRAKAETLQRVAMLADGGLLDLGHAVDIEAACAQLLAIKGVGPWTVNYALLRGYGYPDCSLEGDVAIRSAFQRLLGEDSKPDMARTAALLAAYRPHRTMAAAHLWASLSMTNA